MKCALCEKGRRGVQLGSGFGAPANLVRSKWLMSTAAKLNMAPREVARPPTLETGARADGDKGDGGPLFRPSAKRDAFPCCGATHESARIIKGERPNRAQSQHGAFLLSGVLMWPN